jgi:hypothetical protein
MFQITDRVIMIRPKHFGYNADTAANNTFQQDDPSLSSEEISAQALREFDAFVHVLEMHGVHVDAIDDTDTPVKPDALFPNNWFSTHADGAVITYPMMSPSRRTERRDDIIAYLAKHFRISKHYAFEVFEEQDQYLEGTGSLVLDREHQIAYACLSPRTHLSLVEKFCVLRGYEPCVFHAIYKGVPVYHTNVVMALAAQYVVICLDAIPDSGERARLNDTFAQTQKTVIEITPDQMASFAGNLVQLQSRFGETLCVMSEQALRALREDQVAAISQYDRILAAPVHTIEKYGGGSVRCMIAENFLPGLTEMRK